MSAAWAAVAISGALAAGGIVRGLIARAARDGKLDEAVATLTKIAADHETRLRAVEGGGARSGRQRR